MIHFSKLRWKNFLSTGNVFTELQLDRSPTTVIVGENGAGKSTMLDALCWVLFNKPFRQIKMIQLINSVNNKDTRVEVEFRIGSIDYKVVRGYKKSIFEIWKNGELLPQPGSIKDYQIMLEEQILKLNYKSFTQVVILGSATFTPFMQLAVRDRREVIEDLLDIQIFSQMNMLLKDRISKNKNEQTDIAYQLELTENKIEVQQKYLNQLQQDLTSEIEEYQSLIEEKRNEVAGCDIENTLLQDKVDACLNSIADAASAKKKSNKASELLSKLQDKSYKAGKRKEFFDVNEHCPTCEQTISEEMRLDKITRMQEIIDKTTDGITQLQEEQSKLTDRLAAIKETQTEVQQLQASIQTNLSDINAINKTITQYEKKLADLKEKSNVDNSDAANEIATLTTEMETLSGKKEQLVIDREILEMASHMLKDGGIKTKIIKQYIPIINKLVNKYLAAMDFFVDFTLDEEFNEVIRSRHRDDFSYASFSEGEKARIDLSLMLTWRAVAKLKNSVNTNLLILDEVFDGSLDANGSEILMNLFNELNDTNIFVISHKGDMMIDKFRSLIKFEKVKSFSRIAE